MRTEDTSYGQDYWDTLDGGRGYHDSLLWSDLAFIIHHSLAHKGGRDIAGEMSPHVDVGCALGYMVKHMRARGFESFGLDFSSYALDKAPWDVQTYLRWFDLSAENRSFFGEGHFGMLTCFETLEHIRAESSEQALNHLWTLLRPGGVAVATICVAGQPGWDSDPTHVNVVERSWWNPPILRQGFTIDYEAIEELQRFHLFKEHKGIWVLRKPE